MKELKKERYLDSSQIDMKGKIKKIPRQSILKHEKEKTKMIKGGKRKKVIEQ